MVQLANPRASAAVGRGARGSCLAATFGRSEAATAPALEQGLAESSNIVSVPNGMDLALSEGQRRKLELQAQAAAALAAENSWWQDTADSPPNLVTAHTPADYKRLIVEAPPSQLVVVDYLKPSCMGCRRIFPKLKQLAASNPDALFIKVNVESEEMRELGQGMQVTHLPWFHLFRGGDLVASLTANLATVSQLRAEIATNKPCCDPGCSVY
ncbi:hypothetical protein CHLNCDRAFT_140696 [Chlorella variabilis]|uniref:Thioredoxin domain-containing protein n=1 Tax=Chlorella variabilis TaxID=554065 RepID=E1Z5Z9_CHLVA|nr:hypothetical protein CHLNCDRAFT_140696 [Chlorella variabilis]EFN58844.1 hypothetical protein CHLNCDRAFT_140696 [Chlorella variabilis]|eukprot:XP_005850946.1 hypothetical protein CHLNCDRAFT_140696 [Chlorella variabilis]